MQKSKVLIIPKGDMEIEISKGKIKTCFKIEPVTVISIKDEKHISTRDSNAYYAHPCRLKECCLESVSIALCNCSVPGSVIVKSSKGYIYEEEKDYKVSYKWASVLTLETGKIKDGEEIYINYKYSLARIDTVYITKGGKVFLKKGLEKRESPKPPELNKGCFALANIYLPYNTTVITKDNIYPIRRLPKIAQKELKQKSNYVKKTLEKLKKGEPVKIVFWGDSVTVGGDARPPEKAFAYLFPKARSSIPF